MDSTMQDADVLVSDLLIHGQRVHPDAAVAEFHGATTRRLPLHRGPG